MKPSIAHVSPTLPAALAAAIGISLSVFLVSGGAGLQGEPTPLLPAIAGATGRIAADLPAPAHRHASAPVRKAAPAERLVATRTAQVEPQRRHAATTVHRAHARVRTRVVRHRAPAAPVQVAARVAPVAPVTTSRWSSTPRAKGKARGHGHASRPAVAPGVRGHGHGKALGHSSEHHHGRPPGQAKRTAPAAPAPADPTRADHGGNGHKGGRK